MEINYLHLILALLFSMLNMFMYTYCLHGEVSGIGIREICLSATLAAIGGMVPQFAASELEGLALMVGLVALLQAALFKWMFEESWYSTIVALIKATCLCAITFAVVYAVLLFIADYAFKQFLGFGLDDKRFF